MHKISQTCEASLAEVVSMLKATSIVKISGLVILIQSATNLEAGRPLSVYNT